MPRPSKYTKAIADKIIEAIANGHNRVDAARLVGINPETLYDWMRTKPDFSEAVHEADSRAADIGVSALLKAVNKGDVKAITLWLQAKRPEDWGQRSRVDIGNADNQPFLTAGVDLGQLSTADLMKLLEIAEKASYDDTTSTDSTDSKSP